LGSCRVFFRAGVAAGLRGLALLLPLVSGACAAGDAPSPQPDETVRLELKEWSLQLSQDTVPPGRVTFRMINTGTLVHSVAIEGNGVQELSDHLAYGDTGTLAVELAPGTYRVYCPVKETGDHDRLGMHANLIVR
jgi:plastocyanin